MLLITIAAVLVNARSRLDDIMGLSFLERMDRSFFFPSGDKTDGLTALDLGKRAMDGQRDL